ncbi:hypothetical protein IGI04_030360 [Brassica rapa subsp. trilocularis]|uniref:Uncharacterized protein n=1 Tax=Brassica rapa subsp. trilocularis TaxID=1813537 RepID=A0ABQ7LQH5_BRACM|nr:hypothetical protein IGI04_030360 [Brassica rapa subsp. trilocularis]
MAVDEQDDPSEFTPRETELQRQIDGLQSQVTDLHKARETTENPELSSEIQSLNEKLGEHSKQLELSAKKLNQLQTESAALRDQNKAPNTASNKKHRFNTRVQPMGSLSTPNTGKGTTNATPASGAARATREGIEDHQIYDLEKRIQGLRKQEPGQDPIPAIRKRRGDLVNTLRQMGQQVKWPPKMKAPDSFRNPVLWCDFHRDHGHKTEDCVPLKIEVNELLQKGHLREFLSEKAKAHLSKEASGKSKGDAPSSPPRQDRVIHVISGGP